MKVTLNRNFITGILLVLGQFSKALPMMDREFDRTSPHSVKLPSTLPQGSIQPNWP